MSVLSYSSCLIEYIPSDENRPIRNYSQRSLIELRQTDDGTITLRAVDIENNRTEIFNLPLKNRNQYRFGVSPDTPDQIEHNDGTYWFWLAFDSRQQFHELLCTILEALFPLEVIKSTPSLDSNFLTSTTSLTEKSTPKKQEKSTSEPVFSSPKNLLNDVHDLNRFITEGRSDQAVQIIDQLIKQGIRLSSNSIEQSENEEKFSVFVQLDGNEYGLDQNGGIISINVYPSTTIRELRAAFEIAYHYSPWNQYFFVNGKLVQDNSTMKDLHVGPHSLFVLFILGHVKQFEAEKLWKCSICRTQNSSDALQCRLCSAFRTC